jgi:hypothetical protein
MATMIDIDEPAIKLDRRVNESWLAAHEFRALQVLARQLPAAVTPDHLTALGVAGAGLVLLGGMLSTRSIEWLWLSNLGLLVHWYGDSLDGTVARLRGIERPRYASTLTR